MEITKQQEEQIKKISENLEMDLLYFIKDSDAETIDELDNYLVEQNAFDIEIIYYHNAMEYLHENDNSLKESLAIASELCYKTEDLNSEILASLLATQNERESFDEIKDELEEILFSDNQ